ncbi:MAG: MoaD/ThiS family protein [Thermoplasmata archaeon]
MSSEITVTIKFFAATRDAVGKSRIIKEVPKGTTAKDILNMLKKEYSALDETSKQVIVAINKETGRGGESLVDGDEIALLPPVSGG